MNATPLFAFAEDGRYVMVEACYCGRCRQLWSSEHEANRCCTCSFCGEYVDWRRSVSHDACQTKRLRDSEREAMEAAAEVEDGPILWDENLPVFMDAAELVEYLEDHDTPIPEFAFATRTEAVSIDADDIISRIVDEHHEDIDIDGEAELRIAIDAFNEANAGNVTYWEDRTRKIRLRPKSVEGVGS